MQVVVNGKTYRVRFELSYYEDTEGGMNSGTIGKPYETLEEAIPKLEEARVKETDPNIDWEINCDVVKEES